MFFGIEFSKYTSRFFMKYVINFFREFVIQFFFHSQDSVVLGGTHQHNDWNTNPYDEDREFILKGCKALLPFALNDAKFLKDWVGLRPGRDSVRLERDQVKFDGKTFNVSIVSM